MDAKLTEKVSQNVENVVTVAIIASAVVVPIVALLLLINSMDRSEEHTSELQSR
jgi:hypothetical protein